MLFRNKQISHFFLSLIFDFFFSFFHSFSLILPLALDGPPGSSLRLLLGWIFIISGLGLQNTNAVVNLQSNVSHFNGSLTLSKDYKLMWCLSCVWCDVKIGVGNQPQIWTQCVMHVMQSAHCSLNRTLTIVSMQSCMHVTKIFLINFSISSRKKSVVFGLRQRNDLYSFRLNSYLTFQGFWSEEKMR